MLQNTYVNAWSLIIWQISFCLFDRYGQWKTSAGVHILIRWSSWQCALISNLQKNTAWIILNYTLIFGNHLMTVFIRGSLQTLKPASRQQWHLEDFHPLPSQCSNWCTYRLKFKSNWNCQNYQPLDAIFKWYIKLFIALT